MLSNFSSPINDPANTWPVLDYLFPKGSYFLFYKVIQNLATLYLEESMPSALGISLTNRLSGKESHVISEVGT